LLVAIKFSLEVYMSGTCKEWFDSIGCKSTLDKEQYTHLVWCAALASKVENFTDNQQLKEDICPECDGDGEVSWDIAKVKCSACKGTGIRSSI
jgi:DnaJ-class molecular chaperone